VTKEASLEARKAMIGATSTGCAGRFITVSYREREVRGKRRLEGRKK